MDTSLTPNLNDIFAYVDEHGQAFLARLIDYVHVRVSALMVKGLVRLRNISRT